MDNGNGMLSCGCYVWMWILFFCKYIFVVIQYIEFLWEDLLFEYFFFLYFNIDFYVIGILIFILFEIFEEEEVENESFDGVVYFGDFDGDDVL